MGFLPNGSHSFEGGVRRNEQLLWEKHIHTVMYNKTNAKLGNVLVTWPCGVGWECNGGEKWGEAGWGEMGGGDWSGRSHINDHCARINSAQCIPV